MELLLIINGVRDVRTVSRNGREYLVTTATLIVPGVLNGSNGPLLYPDEEVARDITQWNDTPITVGHPVRNGYHVSGRDPEVNVIGRLHRTVFNGKLQAEAWFDVQLTERIEPRILDALRSRKPFGLSTGLYTTNMPAPTGSRWKDGREYTAVARNYKADHLAVLLDTPGACSIRDGCGFLIANSEGGAALESHFVPNDSPSADPDFISELNGLWETFNKAFPSGKLEMTPEKACKIMKDGSVQGHPLTSRQKGMFGAMCGKSLKRNEAGDWTPTDGSTLVSNSNPDGDTTMPLTQEARKIIIQNLVTNCGCQHLPPGAPWAGKSAEDLEKLTDNDLTAFNASREFISNNSPQQSFVDAQGNRHEYDPSLKAWKTTPKTSTPSPQPAPTANGNQMSQDQWLAQMPESFRPVWNSAVEVHNDQKNHLINALVANMAAGSSRDEMVKYLGAKPLEELKMLHSMYSHIAPQTAPQTPAYNPFAAPTTNYGPASGVYPAPVVTEQPLPSPTYNFRNPLENKAGTAKKAVA